MNNFIKKKNFWKNKKVFITGHNGFKGSWLCLTLKILGSKVYGYSLKPPTKPNLFNLLKIKKKIDKDIFGDVRDKKKLKQSINQVKPDIVFHLAAQPLVLDSYKRPYETFEINFLGTLNILEIVNSLKKIKSTVIVTTDKVYKISSSKKSYSESDDLGITDPYGSSKVTAEIASECYIKLLNKNKKTLKVATVRAGNVLGGGDFSKNRLVPDLIRSLEKNSKFLVRNSAHIRPWQFVMEPLYGYIILAEKIFKREIKINDYCWNFAPENKNCINVKKFIMLFNKSFKQKLKIIYQSSNTTINKETKILRLSSQKANKILKWKSIYGINKIIELIKEWYFDGYKKKHNHESLVKKQIISFISKN